MKAALYKNVDLVLIPIKKGITEYYLPQNVSWAKESVEKLLICTPTLECLSPIDGVTPVMQKSAMQNLYLNIFTADDEEITYEASAGLLYHTNNYPIEIGAALNLSLCRMIFTTAPAEDCCMLMYVFYGGHTEDDYEPAKQSITVSFPLQANERLTFQEIINTYIHALPHKVRAITCWDAESNPAYLTLRDHQLSYIVRDLHTEMCRPPMIGEDAESTQAFPFLVDNMDIDFDYSFIQNAGSAANKQTITFHF